VFVVSADITISGKLFHTFTIWNGLPLETRACSSLLTLQKKIFLNHSDIVHDRKRRAATMGEHCQQLIVDAWNHLERGIEVDIRALLGGVACATIVTFRVCSLYLT